MSKPVANPAPDRILEPLSRRSGGLERVSWDAALDEAERLLRDATGHVVTALSGTETIEQAYALGRLLRGGLGAHSAVLPESTSDALDAFRAPLSTIGEAELVVVVGDDPVVDRAPIVDLWIRRARRNGAQVITIGALGEIIEEGIERDPRGHVTPIERNISMNSVANCTMLTAALILIGPAAPLRLRGRRMSRGDFVRGDGARPGFQGQAAARWQRPPLGQPGRAHDPGGIPGCPG